MLDRIITWITVEPVIALLMTVTAVMLFGSAITQAAASSGAFWPWLRRIIESAVGAALFLGLLWGFRSILNNNMAEFYSTHGSLSDISRESAMSIWGRPHVQRELSVTHFVDQVVKEEIPREDPSLPPLYRETTVHEVAPQNSILGFEGQVDLVLSEREKGYALYNGYLINARFIYHIINDSNEETQAEFAFPLSPGQTLFENFSVLMDEQDISPQLRFSQDLVQWSYIMSPHQQTDIVIAYGSRGMESFYYQMPTQREIKDFTLTVTIDRLPVTLLNYPDGVLTPTNIQSTADRLGSILTWKLDHAITTAGMGVALLQPQQPGAEVLQVLINSSYALTLLGAMLALTLMIRGERVNFLELSLLASAYSVQFLIMAALGDSALGFWGSLALGAALTGLLTFLLYRKHPSRLLRIIIFALVAFFAVIYPLSGLLSDFAQRNAVDNLVQVGLIVYVFGLALYTRRERASHLAVTA